MSKMKNIKSKRLLSLLLITAMLLSMFPLSAITVSAASSIGSTPDNPIIVNDFQQFHDALISTSDDEQYIKVGSDFSSQSMNGYSGLIVTDLIKVTKKKHLDLNGKKVNLVSEQEKCYPIAIKGYNAKLTIDDSVGGGEINYETRGMGNKLIEVMIGELVLNGGTLTSKMKSGNNYAYFGVVTVDNEGSVTVNDGKILYKSLYDDKYYDDKTMPIIWESGITLPFNGGRVTVNGGEITRLVARINTTLNGDKYPKIIINGGVFHRSLGFYVDALDYNVPRTFPVQINGGEFRYDSTISGSNAAPFTIYASGNLSSKVPLSNFPDGDENSTNTYVLDYLRDVEKNLFPTDCALLVGDKGYECSNTTFNSVMKVIIGSSNNGRYHVWLNTGSETVKISKFPYIKAEYNGAEVPDGSYDNRFATDLKKNNKFKLTWNAPSSTVADWGYELKIQCVVTFTGVNYTINNILGVSNGDGTLSAVIALPEIEEDTDYELHLIAGFLKEGAEDCAAVSGRMLCLKSQTSDFVNLYSVNLIQNGGDIHPDIYYGKPETAYEISVQSGAKCTVLSQTNWSGEFNGNYFIAGNIYTKTVKLRAESGYKFSSICKIKIDALSAEGVKASLSSDRKTMTVIIKAKAVTVLKEAHGTLKGFYQGKNVNDVYVESAEPNKYSIEVVYIGQKKNSNEMIEPNPEYFVKGTPYIFGVKIVPKKGYGFLETVWGDVTLNIPMDQSYARDDNVTTKYTTHAQVGSVSYDGKFFETEPDNNGCYAPEQPVSQSYTVSGTVNSFGSNADDVTVQLIEQGTTEPAYETYVNGNTAYYSFNNVVKGTYTLRVIKKNHIAREYTVIVGSANVTQNVKIYLLGDVNMDGSISIKDTTETLKCTVGLITLDEYQSKLADVISDGKVSVNDATQILKCTTGLINKF